MLSITPIRREEVTSTRASAHGGARPTSERSPTGNSRGTILHPLAGLNGPSLAQLSLSNGRTSSLDDRIPTSTSRNSTQQQPALIPRLVALIRREMRDLKIAWTQLRNMSRKSAKPHKVWQSACSGGFVGLVLEGCEAVGLLQLLKSTSLGFFGGTLLVNFVSVACLAAFEPVSKWLRRSPTHSQPKKLRGSESRRSEFFRRLALHSAGHLSVEVVGGYLSLGIAGLFGVTSLPLAVGGKLIGAVAWHSFAEVLFQQWLRVRQAGRMAQVRGTHSLLGGSLIDQVTDSATPASNPSQPLSNLSIQSFRRPLPADSKPLGVAVKKGGSIARQYGLTCARAALELMRHRQFDNALRMAQSLPDHAHMFATNSSRGSEALQTQKFRSTLLSLVVHLSADETRIEKSMRAECLKSVLSALSILRTNSARVSRHGRKTENLASA